MVFKDKVIVITGCASGIGLAIATHFEKQGAKVYGIDIKPTKYFKGDLGKKSDIDAFVKVVKKEAKAVDIIINNALPLSKGINNCSYDDFEYALKVGVTAPFYLVQSLLPILTNGSSIINISSTRAHMSQPQGESYAAAKGAISALTRALAVSLGPKVRVNAILPGWINTTNYQPSKEDKAQHPVGRIGEVSDIVNLVEYLSSEKASFITGQEFVVDGGMTKQMIYHNDYGWSFNKE